MNVVICKETSANSWEDVLKKCSTALSDKGLVKDTFFKGCYDRELVFPTGLQFSCGVAIPHTDSIHVNETSICFMKLNDPVVFKSMEDIEDEVSVSLVFMLAISDSGDHISFLSKIINLLKEKDFLDRCLSLNENEISDFLYSSIIN